MPAPPAAGFTVEAWIRPEPGAPPRADIAARRAPRGGSDTFTFRIRNDLGGVLELGLASEGGTWGMAGDAVVPVDRWSHAAATWDAASGKVRIFLDGVLDAERDGPIPPGRDPAPLWLGGDPLHGPEGRPWKGWLDELRVWDHARPAEQIREGRTRPLHGDEPGLMLAWPLDEGEGQTAHDRGPLGLHGQLGRSPEVDAEDPAWSDERPY